MINSLFPPLKRWVILKRWVMLKWWAMLKR